MERERQIDSETGDTEIGGERKRDRNRDRETLRGKEKKREIEMEERESKRGKAREGKRQRQRQKQRQREREERKKKREREREKEEREMEEREEIVIKSTPRRIRAKFEEYKKLFDVIPFAEKDDIHFSLFSLNKLSHFKEVTRKITGWLI